MSNKTKFHTRVAIAIIVSAVFMRLIPHIPNFAPLTAGALFAAVYLPKRYVLIVPLMAAMISDYLLLYVNPFSQQVFNFSQLQPLSAMFNSTTAWVWGSFMVSGLIGLWLRENHKPTRIFGATMLASFQFFLVTNFGVWAAGAYSRGWYGIVESYIAGLPFLRWTMLGDVFYAVCFFGIYALVTMQAKEPAKQDLVQAT